MVNEISPFLGTCIRLVFIRSKNKNVIFTIQILLLQRSENNLKHVSQAQIYLMNGGLHYYIFRSQRNYHQAINTKYANLISSW